MASRESGLLFSLERGLRIAVWVRQEKKALTSRGGAISGVSSSCGTRGGFLLRHDEDLRVSSTVFDNLFFAKTQLDLYREVEGRYVHKNLMSKHQVQLAHRGGIYPSDLLCRCSLDFFSGLCLQEGSSPGLISF